MNILIQNKDTQNLMWATYWVKSGTTLLQAAKEIAIGQSIGNPNARSLWETDQLIEDFCGKILATDNLADQEGHIQIGYPVGLIDWAHDGISQMLCVLMGGQMDIDNIKACNLVDVQVPDHIIKKHFLGPRQGITGIRSRLGKHNQPLFGGIVKPKLGITPTQLLDLVKEMVEGGVDFIKEDEILSNPEVCALRERVPLISKYLQDKKVIYCFCINSDPAHVLNRAQFVSQEGGNGIHVNVWSGLGVYKSLRELDLPLFIHYQKSGDRTFTNPAHAYHVKWQVLCKLAAWSGVDFIHAGMWGGYSNYEEAELTQVLHTLRSHNVMPALSCGMHAGLVKPITNKFGVDWMANVGGAIHSDPAGTRAGCIKMRQAVDACAS